MTMPLVLIFKGTFFTHIPIAFGARNCLNSHIGIFVINFFLFFAYFDSGWIRPEFINNYIWRSILLIYISHTSHDDIRLRVQIFLFPSYKASKKFYQLSNHICVSICIITTRYYLFNGSIPRHGLKVCKCLLR